MPVQILSEIQNFSLCHRVLKQGCGGILRLFTAAKNRNTATLISGRRQNILVLWEEGNLVVEINSLQEAPEFGAAGKPMIVVFLCPFQLRDLPCCSSVARATEGKFQVCPQLQWYCSWISRLCLCAHPVMNSLSGPGLPRPVFHTDELMDRLKARDWLEAKWLTELLATFCHN